MTTPPSGYRRRNSLRHPCHDYTKAGAYFVTFCAHQGRSIFGQVIDRKMVLNPLGQIAEDAWQKFANRHANVTVDVYVIMPNHVHVLLRLVQDPDIDNQDSTPKTRAFGDAIADSLSTLIGAYKSSVTQPARRAGLAPGQPIWQRNFYDSIVRNEAGLQRIRDYIRANPVRW